MGVIRRRAKTGNLQIKLSDLLPPPETKEGEGPEDFLRRDVFAPERETLAAAEAILVIRRVTGQKVDEWTRQHSRAQAMKAKADLAFRKEHGLPEGEDPEAAQILLDMYASIFKDAYVELYGFEEVTDAKSAWAAIYDFLPFLSLVVGARVMSSQKAKRPES